MLHHTLVSVHGGQGSAGGHPGGGVMDDGRRFVVSPLPHPPASLLAPEEQSKSRSLPGYYCRRPTSPPQTFRDAFASTYAVPVAMQPFPLPSTPHPSRAALERAVSESSPARSTEKKGRRILGGLFRRRRKSGSPSSTTSSDISSDGAPPRRRFFSRKSSRRKKGRASKESPVDGGFPPPSQVDTVALNVSAHRFRSQTTYLLTTDTGKVLKMSPTGSLGREAGPGHYYSTLVDGTAHSPATTLSSLHPPGVSASHDSLVESAYGSINSSLRSSAHGGDRSSSTDTLTRRERREVLKARVERLRERSRAIGGGSSSEEGDPGGSLSSQFGSENSLTQGDSGHRKTRSSRTERYIRRKSHELETLRVETEKDRRNREAVQARILEIQKNQKGRSSGVVVSAPVHCDHRQDKPKQVSSTAGIHVTPNPPEHPVISPKGLSRQQYVVKKLSDALDPSQAPFSYTQGGRYPLSPEGILHPHEGPPQRYTGNQFSSMGTPQRSLSYDNHINKAASVPPLDSTSPLRVRSRGLTPPEPPPRDRSSSYLSPYEIPTHRPMSYSFENLPYESQLGPHQSFRRIAPLPPARGEPLSTVTPCRRSLSEKYLNIPKGEDPHLTGRDASGGYSSLPTRPALPRIYSNENYSRDFHSLRAPCCSLSPRSLSVVGPRENLGPGRIAPSSPCSDYSSYVSDHSFQKVASGPQPHPQLHPPPLDTVGVSPERETVHPSMKKGDIPTDALQPVRDPVLAGLTKRLSCLSPRVSLSMLEKTPAQSQRVQHSVAQTPVVKKPLPPKRNSSQELLKQRLDDPKQCQKFREFYLKEKERLKDCPSANFEEALQELERIYESLNLSAEETSNGTLGNGEKQESRSRTPDKTKDDLHVRQVSLSRRNPQENNKGNIATGSYLLVSPVHAPPSLGSGIPDPNTEKEPDIVSDDVTVRNHQMANAVKVLDPQPPFGIPLGPLPLGARSDYLNADPSKVSRDNSPTRRTPNREPDIVLDDLAFRSLRKDGTPGRSASTKAVNTFGLDELLDRVSGAPPILSRSRSVPRSTSINKAPLRGIPGSFDPLSKKSPEAAPTRTPRQLKAKKGGVGFCDSFKDALTDGDSRGRESPSLLAPKRPEERASTADDLPEALTQWRMRHGIIHASRFPAAEERESEPSDEEGMPYDHPNPFKDMIDPVPVPPPPPVLQSSGPPVVCQSHAEEGAHVSAVDIAHLDHLISSLTESVPRGLRPTSPKRLIPDRHCPSRPDTAHLDFEKAKANIQSAIRLSMATVAPTAVPEGTPVSSSNNSEGNNNLSGSIRANRMHSNTDSSNTPFTSVPLPPPLVLSRPQTVMSTNITSRHFPTPSTAQLVNLGPGLEAPSSKPLSSPTDESKGSPEALKYHWRLRRARSVPPPAPALDPDSRVGHPAPPSSSSKKSRRRRASSSSRSSSARVRRSSAPIAFTRDKIPLLEGEVSLPFRSPSSSSSLSPTHEEGDKGDCTLPQVENLPSPPVGMSLVPCGPPPEIGDVSSAGPKIHQGSPSPVDPGGDKRKRRLEYEKQRLQTLARKKPVPLSRSGPGARKKEEEQGEKNKDEEQGERKKKEEEEGDKTNKFARKTPAETGVRRAAGDATTNSKGGGEGVNALKLIRSPNSGEKCPRNALLSAAPRPQLNLKEKDCPVVETPRTPGFSKNAPKDPPPGEIRNMVQERRVVVPGGERKGTTPQAPLSGTSGPVMKSIRGVVGSSEVTGDSTPDTAEQEKRERIQRYKEQRRKQMAARYGAKEASSSEDDALHPLSSGNAYGRRRRRHRSGLADSTHETLAPEDKTSQGSEPHSDNCKKETEGSLEPSGSAIPRPSSPAQCLTTVCSANHLCNNNGPSASQDDAPVVPAIKDPSSEPTSPRITHGEARVDSADSTLSGSEGRPGGRRRGSGEERDKSYKRKSHLNRASTSEEAVYPPAPLSSHLSDSGEEVPRRRRRRNPQLSDSTNTSSPTTTPPDATTPRGTPLGASLSTVTTDGQAGTLPPVTPNVLSRGISHSTGGATSAPATLDHRYKADKLDGVGTPLMRGSTPKQTLKKPNIPEVFRPRDPNAPLGVVLNHTRPSPSLAMDKPPLGPEGSAGTRPFKSSLKKTPEAFSCFLAPKRERKFGVESPSIDALKPRVEPPSGDSVLLECEQYLKENKQPQTGYTHTEYTMALSPHNPSVPTGAPSTDKGSVSDSGQKNWGGGPEDTGDKIPRRLVFQDQVKGGSPPSSHPGLAPGPPYSTHGNMKDDEGGGKMEEVAPSSGFELGSFPVTRRRSYSAKEDLEKSLTPPSGQGILKKSSCPPHAGWGRVGTGSFDVASLEGCLDPRPILKKKSSVEEDPPLGPHDPRKKSILKKKSLTDDELDWDRPRSILKGARSREDLVEHRGDITGGLSPIPILKRGSRETPVDLDGGGELRPILKRRDTTDGIRPFILKPGGADHQGGALVDKGEPILLRRDSAPTPSHGILKRRPTSPSLDALQSAGNQGSVSERPLSVAERVAGMEAMQNSGSEPPQGAKPKVRSRPSSGERPVTPILSDRDTRRNTWTPSSPNSGVPIPDGDKFRCIEAVNPLFSPGTSRVSQKAAFFSKLEQEKNVTPPHSPLAPSINKKERGTRFATQPITEGEVSKASQLLDASTEPEVQENGVESGTEVGVLTYSVGARVAMWSKKLQEPEAKPSRPLDPGAKRKRARFMTQPVTMAEVASAAALNAQDSQSASVTTPCSRAVSQEAAPFLKLSAESLSSISRRMSAHDLALEDSVVGPMAFGYGDTVKGILKTEGPTPRDRSKESPRSILRADSRKSSLSEGEHYPRGILKPESPMSSTKGSPEHESRGLRSVLKKDSSLEDSRGIKSILKPESQSLDPEISSDSSSETVIQTVNHSLVEAFGTPSTSVLPSASEGEYLARRASMTQQVLQEAVKQALPMMTKDNLAEALRQIEPIAREKASVDLTDGTRSLTTDEVISSIREKSLKKGGEEEGSGVLQPLSPTAERRVENLTRSSAASVVRKFEHTTNGLPRSSRCDDRALDTLAPVDAHEDDDEEETDSEIDECKASIKQTIKSLTVLGQTEQSKFSRERVTLRAKTGQLKKASHTDRWTLNDFSSCRTAANSSPVCGSPPSRSSSSTSSTSSPVEPRKAKLLSPTDFALSTPEVVCLPQPLRASSAATISSSLETSSFEKDVVEGLVPSSSIGSSINARLVSLQKNGDEGWKNRVFKDEDLLSPKKIRAKAPRPTSLLERVTQLESSSQQWKGRVTQTDATKFTVAHKMASASSVPSLSAGSSSSAEEKSRSCYRGPVTGPTGLLQSPASERRKRSPLPKVFKSKTGGCLPDLFAKEAPPQDQVKPFPRSVSITSPAVDPDEEESAIVAIPRPDDESFNAFFVSSTVSRPMERGLDLEEYDASAFDHIASHSSRLAVKRRSIRAARTKASSTNPLKSLAQREDVRSEYTQVTLGVGERELRRMKVEELSKSSSLAMEALAGLASKENFSAVALKRVENNPIVREMSPHSELMLIQVKGRRHPQVRLVEPRCQSVNQGDDFLLITPHELFHYKGPFANVIERAVASEMALYILQTKDMGVTSAIKVTDIEENSPTAKKERFWSKLGGSCESEGVPPGPPDSDDHIEAALIASNKVFEVRGQSMVPMEGAWGQSPKYELLSSDKVLVFDFGSELYIWTGKRAPFEEKRQGTLLVKELWKENFDYSDCDVNPTCPPVNLGDVTPMKGARPDWGICGKITENVETILFKEKFLDWPDTAQQIRIKEVRSEAGQKCDPVCDLEPSDVNNMISSRPLDPDLILEMSHLGRGVVYYDEEERRLHTISTNDFKVWHISENEKKQLLGSTACHFYSGETYVVRWYYHVTATGRTLKGTPSRHNVTGRSRVAYFFWQGRTSSVSDKGVSALMTVELDEERGPHVRVTMGAEPPAFLNLFEGSLVIHDGKRDLNTQGSGPETTVVARLFVVRGEFHNEAHLVEVDLSSYHLRSRGCLILANLHARKVHLWIGSKVMTTSKEVGLSAARRLCDSPAEAMGWRGTKRKADTSPSIEIQEELEGRESTDFLTFLDLSHSDSRPTYFSLMKEVGVPFDWTIRAWKLEAKTDAFQPLELSSSYRALDRVCAFPLWQEELYSTDQPAIFLVDAGLKVYIWQGWFPEGDTEDAGALVTGSAYLRFTFARRAALQTALHYVRKKEEMIKNSAFKNGSFNIADCPTLLNPKLVVAGMESLEFTNLFPIWTPHEDVTQIQAKECRWTLGQEYCVRDVLEQLSREKYSLKELQMVPLPDGVDPLRLERYLSDRDFQETLGVSRNEFLSLPSWKQLQLKKKGNLF